MGMTDLFAALLVVGIRVAEDACEILAHCPVLSCVSHVSCQARGRMGQGKARQGSQRGERSR